MNFKGKGSYLNGEGLKYPKSALKAVINPLITTFNYFTSYKTKLTSFNSVCKQTYMHSNYALYGSFPVNWSRNLCYFFETRDLKLDWTWFFFRGGKGGKSGDKSGSSSRIYHRPSLPGTLWWCRPPTQGYRIAIHHSEVPGDDGRWKIRLKSAVAVKSPIQIPASGWRLRQGVPTHGQRRRLLARH